jgi:COP9 signalosome complex subunit 5
VNAGASANEFMCMYSDLNERVNKAENVIGWYHSHPGYRPWLSGIDVSTQRLYQRGSGAAKCGMFFRTGQIS